MKNLDKRVIFEWLIAGVLMLVSGYVMVYGYSLVSKHMEVAKNQPVITNFKNADPEIKKALLKAKPTVDPDALKVDQVLFEKIYVTNFSHISYLKDVTLGADMDGHLTEGKTYSVIKANYDRTLEQFAVYGIFAGLPKLREGYYYEAWLVRKNPFSLISLGKILIIDDEFSNVYASSRDLSDYTHYIVTLEHNDDNPLPEVMILEGTFEMIKQ